MNEFGNKTWADTKLSVVFVWHKYVCFAVEISVFVKWHAVWIPPGEYVYKNM